MSGARRTICLTPRCRNFPTNIGTIFVFNIAFAWSVAFATFAYASPREILPLPAPTTSVTAQTRTALKHRTPPAIYSATRMSVPAFIALNKQLPASLKDPKVRKSNSAISPIEKKVYAVDGDLWRVKMEGNDDDYHLELSNRGAGRTSDRIIVEIPAGSGYEKVRRQFLSLLPGNYIFQPDTTKDLPTSIPIRIIGYGFCDTTHWTSKSVHGNKHGTKYTATLWELHPVWKVEALKP